MIFTWHKWKKKIVFVNGRNYGILAEKYGYHGDILKNVDQAEVDLADINTAVPDKAGWSTGPHRTRH